MNLSGKCILFISPKFFNYENEIISFLQKNGAIVDFFDERPSNSQFVKALIRLKFFLVKIYILKYYKNILLNIINKKYDYFLLIKGEATPVSFIQTLRILFPKTKFIYYTYDSFVNNKKSVLFFKYFEKKFSFEIDKYLDKFDFIHRPLFYIPDYGHINKKNLNQDIDLLFIASLHSDRYQIIRRLKNNLIKNGTNLNIFVFFYVSGQFNFYFRNIFQNFFKIKKSDVSFIPLTKLDIVKLFNRSKCIIDIEHPNQKGLTIRTIECIGSRKKIITTNHNIINYDFYTPQNIYIINRDSPEIIDDFFNTEYKNLSENIYFKYSIEGWIEDLFN